MDDTTNNESLRDLVNQMFTRMDVEKEEIAAKKAASSEADTNEGCVEFDQAMGHAEEELETLYQTFIRFQNDIHGLVLAEIVAPGIAGLASMFQFLENILHGDFELTNDSDEAQKEYDKLQALRAGILSELFEHYK